jgi:hypothetical protein
MNRGCLHISKSDQLVEDKGNPWGPGTVMGRLPRATMPPSPHWGCSRPEPSVHQGLNVELAVDSRVRPSWCRYRHKFASVPPFPPLWDREAIEGYRRQWRAP